MTVTVSSLANLGQAWNHIHPEAKVPLPKPTKERVIKCRKCGAKMNHIAGTNVYLCPAILTVPAPTEEKPDATKKVACGNRYLAK